MVRLTLLLALLAGPAGAACFGPPLPKLVHYDSGRTIEILGHTAQDLTIRSTLPNGSENVTTLRNGLFSIASSNNGATFSYGWQSELPALSALRPGQILRFEADMLVEHASRSFVRMDIEVLREDHLVVAGCDYPVIVVQRSDVVNGKEQARLVMWLSPSLRLPLRNETTQAGVTKVFAVTGME
ncbi:MAG: hypothetical protein ACOH2H_14440 [Cypionkella sp.]